MQCAVEFLPALREQFSFGSKLNFETVSFSAFHLLIENGNVSGIKKKGNSRFHSSKSGGVFFTGIFEIESILFETE